jgi:uncharacterized protein (DUF924 family)
MKPREIIDFWMAQPQKRLFSVDPEFDAELRDRFGAAHADAAAGRLDGWLETVDGRLALVLLLDQMSRNLGRGTPGMFANDDKALVIASRAIAEGDRDVLTPTEYRWHVMPLMHSEDLADQDRCVELCREEGLEDTLPHAIEHRGIIARFGRFPHRNRILGRETTEKEQEFLDDGGFSG